MLHSGICLIIVPSPTRTNPEADTSHNIMAFVFSHAIGIVDVQYVVSNLALICNLKLIFHKVCSTKHKGKVFGADNGVENILAAEEVQNSHRA